MKHQFLKRNGDNTLLLLFAGWGMDTRPFAGLADLPSDVAVAYDYSDRNFENLSIEGYDNLLVIAWSFGVFAASRWMQTSQVKPAVAIAINGTPLPVDDRKGIPHRIFNATLDNLSENSLLKFYARMCGSRQACDAFLQQRPERSVESLREELEAIRDEAAATPAPENGWDKAYVALNDRIIPPDCQKCFWSEADVPFLEIDDAHLPALFNDIVRTSLVDKDLVKQKFEAAWDTYDRFALPQRIIAGRLLEKWKAADSRKGCTVYEIGCGTGLFTKLYVPEMQPQELCLNDIARVPEQEFEQLHLPYTLFIADGECNYPERTFDRIVSASAMQWFENIPRFLTSAASLLNPDGLLVLSTFAADNLVELHQASPFSLNYLSPARWEEALDSAGFTPLEISDEKIQMTFDSHLDLLRSLKQTGVNGLQTPHQSPVKMASTLARTLPRTEEGACQLTYNPLFIIAKKK